MRLSEILKNTDARLHGISGESLVMNITTDYKECDKKTLLIVPNSKKAKGVLDAAEEALAVMCDEALSLPETVATVRVKDIRRAMAFAYSYFYEVDYEKFKVIGVTGTNGKTTTASFIREVLSSVGRRVGFIGTGKICIDDKIISDEDYSMTTPDPSLLYRALKRMELEGCTDVVMEVSSHALSLSKVAPIPFEYGVMTNLSSEHMDFHKDIESYYQAKYTLLSSAKCAVLNIDDGYCRRACREILSRRITIGAVFIGDNYVDTVKDHGFDGVSYLYHGRDFTFRMKLKTPGIYNVYNSMLAVAVCTDMGIAPCKVKQALCDISGIEGRFEIIKDVITVIIDYAHTDYALDSVLKSISLSKGKSYLTVIFGAGGERDKQKRPRMARIAERYADRILVTSDNSRGEDPASIIGDIIRGFEKKSYEIIPDRASAIKRGIIDSPDGSIVAIIGKGAERYNIDSNGYHRFDERDIVGAALKERKENANKT